MVRAWFMDDNNEDKRLPHFKKPLEFLSPEHMKTLGVHFNYHDPKHYIEDQDSHHFKRVLDYNYEDEITISPDKLPDYDNKLDQFYDEHVHEHDEIRYILEGTGYFDVRDQNGKWIRIEVSPGDLVVIPAYLFHRFTLDTNNFIKARRFFCGTPVWTPLSRKQMEKEYAFELERNCGLNRRTESITTN